MLSEKQSEILQEYIKTHPSEYVAWVFVNETFIKVHKAGKTLTSRNKLNVSYAILQDDKDEKLSILSTTDEFCYLKMIVQAPYYTTNITKHAKKSYLDVDKIFCVGKKGQLFRLGEIPFGKVIMSQQNEALIYDRLTRIQNIRIEKEESDFAKKALDVYYVPYISDSYQSYDYHRTVSAYKKEQRIFESIFSRENIPHKTFNINGNTLSDSTQKYNYQEKM